MSPLTTAFKAAPPFSAPMFAIVNSMYGKGESGCKDFASSPSSIASLNFAKSRRAVASRKRENRAFGSRATARRPGPRAASGWFCSR